MTATERLTPTCVPQFAAVKLRIGEKPPESLVKHICDVNGVLLEVQYSGPMPVEIQSVHVLGPDYLPTGPDLTFLFHDTLFLTGPSEAERFLSKLVEDIS